MNIACGHHLERLSVLKFHLARVANYERLTSDLYSEISLSRETETIPALAGFSRSASIEDDNHCQVMSGCVERLESVCPYPCSTELSQADTLLLGLDSMQRALRALMHAESGLVRAYQEICSLTIEFDYRIFDLAYRNLYENALHHDSISAILRQVYLLK